ncbi:MAG TPA: hypothetical protein EYO20_00695 [Gemmatimonadetes bacterium]|nr:hypothetical protein [Gemmatimonadota bacterium]
MRCRFLLFSLSLLIAASACGPAEIVVTMEIDVANPDGEGMVTRPLSDIEIQILPYDRDAVFDSMASAFSTPEPPIPEELITERARVQEAQQEWTNYQDRWNLIRDTLQKLSTALEQYNRGESTYVVLFREWNDFDGELGDVERQMNRSFDNFTSLQEGTIEASNSTRMLRENWGDEAFVGAGEVFLAKLRASGLDAVADTTDASGIARQNLRVKPGEYWVHARYELTYTELYWNIPIEVTRGAPVQVSLSRANAEERTKL